MSISVIAVPLLVSCGHDDPAPTAILPQAKLVFADLNWSTALLQNAIARAILEEGYGHETESVPGGTVPLMQALVTGDSYNDVATWWLRNSDEWKDWVVDGVIDKVLGGL